MDLTGSQSIYKVGRAGFGSIELIEQLLSQGKGKPIIRPFCQSAGVSCRRYSIPLQRIITDFGADVPFGRIPKKLQEHYGITVPVSSAQKITQDHGAKRVEGTSNSEPDSDLYGS